MRKKNIGRRFCYSFADIKRQKMQVLVILEDQDPAILTLVKVTDERDGFPPQSLQSAYPTSNL